MVPNQSELANFRFVLGDLRGIGVRIPFILVMLLLGVLWSIGGWHGYVLVV